MVKSLLKYIFTLIALFTSLSLAGCKDDNLMAGGEGEIPGWESSSGDDYYMAIRIYNAASIDAGSRTKGEDPAFDGSGSDYTGSDGKDFNIGTDRENEIYNKYTRVDDCPNFLLVFKESSGSYVLEYLLPLFDWDYEKNGQPKDNEQGSTTSEDNEQGSTTTGYSDYYTFYTSAKKHELPETFDNKKLLVVLNVSNTLKSDLEAAVKISESYDNIIAKTIEQKDAGDRDFVYFTDSSGDKYFTMTSSMVIPRQAIADTKTLTSVGEYGPSVIIRDYSWQPSKEMAAKFPVLSCFVERVQTKYTLTFEFGGTKYYFTADNKATAKDGYTPAGSHLMISSSELANLDDEWKTIYYVTEYTRRNDEDRYDDDHVTQYIHKAKSFKINFNGWGINGIEKRENLFKQIKKEDYYGENNWNPSSYSPYRNFWSLDHNYESTSYPDQYKEAFKVVYDTKTPDILYKASVEEDPSVNPWSDEMADDPDYLQYYTFTNLINHEPHLYSPENTYDPGKLWESEKEKQDALDGRAYMRAGTHLILTAQLLIEGMERPGLYEKPEFNEDGWARTSTNESARSKYYMNGIFWNQESYLEYVSEYLGYWMQKDEDTFGPNDGIFYTSPDLDRSNPPVANNEYFYISPLKIEGGDGWAYITPDLSSLQLEDRGEDQVVLYSYNPENNTYRGITRKQFNILALSHPEYFARHFNRGRMYYAIPVTHYDDGDGDLFLGKYGAVRNHWYNFTVEDIRKLGTPVSDPDQELIIPNTDHTYQSLGLTLSVLPWHLVDTQVNITEQRPSATPDVIDLDLQIKANDWNYEGKESEL